MSDERLPMALRKAGSDVLFGGFLIGSLLTLRRKALNRAYLTQKLTPFAAAILKFEKARQIQSPLFYVQRSVLFIILAGVASGLSYMYDANAAGVLARGCLWGCCFGVIGAGMLVGGIGSVCYWRLQGELKEYL